MNESGWLDVQRRERIVKAKREVALRFVRDLERERDGIKDQLEVIEEYIQGLKQQIDPKLDEKFEAGAGDYQEYRTIPLDEIDEWGKQRAAGMQVLKNEIDAQALAYAQRRYTGI
jgi:hypothetical protein